MENQMNIGSVSVKNLIASLPKTIRIGQQNKHIVDTHEYEQYVIKQSRKGQYGPSRLHGGLDFAQILVDKYSGTGIPRLKNGRWLNYEVIETEEIVGTVVNNLTGAEQLTTRIKIHYSKEGTHVVPHYKNERG